MTNISPLQVNNFLASQPNTTPIYSMLAMNSKNQKIQCCDPRSTRAMIALMDMNAVLGGAASHYGGPAALAEIWSALHALIFFEANSTKKNWFDLYHVINDAGHCENGLYALKANYQMAGLNLEKLKKFRSIDSNLTGHGEAHLFPQGVYMSNGPLGSAFPQAQGLAIAEKLSGAHRTTICTLSDGAAMEGEAKESMAAIPGLAAKGLCAPFVLLISDNNTKLSGRIDQDAFSMRPTFQSLETLGWKVLTLENGNDLQACLVTIESAIEIAQKNPSQPVAVWAKTVKGIGTKKTAEAMSGGHGFPCKSPAELTAFISEIYGTDHYPQEFKNWIEELGQLETKIKASTPSESGEKIQKGISKAMITAAKKGLPVISVTSDLPGSTGVAEFRKEFPKHSLDVGVAESNMISVAAGLSKQGYIPIVDTFAQFGVTKGALPITMANLSEAPVIAVFSHTGFQDAADGASHQALSYMSMLATIPHVDLYSLATSEEADIIMTKVIEKFAEDKKNSKLPKTSVFFLGRENFPKTHSTDQNKLSYVPYQPQIIRQHIIGSKNVMLVTTGSLVGEAIKASQELEKKSIGTIVVHLNCLNHIELSILKPLIQKCEGRIVTVEDHQVSLGMGAYLCHQLIQAGEKIVMKSLGVKGEFGQSAYNAIELYRKHAMDAESITKSACELLG